MMPNILPQATLGFVTFYNSYTTLAVYLPELEAQQTKTFKPLLNLKRSKSGTISRCALARTFRTCQPLTTEHKSPITSG